jgi:hypothetical protein
LEQDGRKKEDKTSNLNTKHLTGRREESLSGEIRIFCRPTFAVGLVNGDGVGPFLELDVGVVDSPSTVRLALHPLPDHQGHAKEQNTTQTEHRVRDSSSGCFGHLGHHFQFLAHIIWQFVDTLNNKCD